MCYSLIVNRARNQNVQVLDSFETVEVWRINPGWATNTFDITFITTEDIYYKESPKIDIYIPFKTWIKSTRIQDMNERMVNEQLFTLEKFLEKAESENPQNNLFSSFNLNGICEIMDGLGIDYKRSTSSNQQDVKKIVEFLKGRILEKTKSDFTIKKGVKNKELKYNLFKVSHPRWYHELNKIEIKLKKYKGYIPKGSLFTLRIEVRFAAAKWSKVTFGEAEAYFFEYPSPRSNKNYMARKRGHKWYSIMKDEKEKNIEYDKEQIMNTLFYMFNFYGCKHITFTEGIEKLSHSYWSKGNIENYSTRNKFRREATTYYFDFLNNPRNGWIIKWYDNFLKVLLRAVSVGILIIGVSAAIIGIGTYFKIF